MSEPSNQELAEKFRAAADCCEQQGCVGGPGFARDFRLAARRLDAALEITARAIFNAAHWSTAEDTTWNVVPEQTREHYRAIARHEWETAEKGRAV